MCNTIQKKINTCVDGLFNATELQIEFEQAIPKGELDDAFRKVCLKWPEVKRCTSEVFDIIEECYDKGNLVTKGIDSMVEFFCGVKNDGALIALFLAEGGLNCLDRYGETVRDCINEHNTEDIQDDLCRSIESTAKCAVTFKKCSDPTPENLISSMIRQVQKVMDCPVTYGAYRADGSSGTETVQKSSVQYSVLISLGLVTLGACLAL